MTATETNKLLAQQVQKTCEHLLPNGVVKDGNWCVGGISGEKGKSLQVCLSGDKAGVWLDFNPAGGGQGDLIGLWKAVKGLDVAAANKEAMAWLGVADEDDPAPNPIPTHRPSEGWLRLQERLRKGSPEELDALASLRGIPSVHGLELATRAGHLWFADVWDDGFDYPAWILTDESRLNAQARKMDGQPWQGIGGIKCKTINGCKASWPVGLSGVNGKDIALVEGSPDFLAAWHYIWLTDMQGKVVPVAMFGAAMNLPDESRPYFAGKRVHAFPHNDADGGGETAMAKWEKQAGVPFTRFDFKPFGLKDLNDLAAVQGSVDDEGNLPAAAKAMFHVAPPSGFTIWQPAEFRAYQPPPNMDLLGGGYLRRKQLTTLIGPPGVGKSRLSLWLACLHISGRPFAGLDMQNGPAKWLFFGNENDPMRQKHDLDWFYRNLTPAEQAKCDTNLFLHVIDKPDDGIITLADEDAYNKLCASLKRVQPDVVVFDPWGNMIEGNENDNEEVRRTLKLLLRALTRNCPDTAVLVIHHARTGKAVAIEAGNNYSGGSLGRGSKALVSAARCELALWPGDSEDSSKLVLTCEKANNVQKFEPKGLLFENGIYRQDEAFDLQTWRDDIEGNRGGKTLTVRDLVEMVKDGCHKSADIVAKCDADFGVQKRTVYTRLNEACDKGYLQKTVPAGSYTLGSKKIG